MGLFDRFKGDKGDSKTMTPHFAFAASLFYMMGADGEYDMEEVGQLLAVIGGKRKDGKIYVGGNNDDLLESVQKYIARNSVDTFLREATPILTDAQKLAILTNLIDSSLADGEAEREEQQLFEKFMSAFGITEERFAPFFEVLAIKNDRSIFTNQNHEKNRLEKVELQGV